MSLNGSFLFGRQSPVGHPSGNQGSSCRRKSCSAASAHPKPRRSSYLATAPRRPRSLRRHELSRRSSKSAVSDSSMPPPSGSLVESPHLHLGLREGYCFRTGRIDALCSIIRACCEISAHEQCYHGTLQSHGMLVLSDRAEPCYRSWVDSVVVVCTTRRREEKRGYRARAMGTRFVSFPQSGTVRRENRYDTSAAVY